MNKLVISVAKNWKLLLGFNGLLLALVTFILVSTPKTWTAKAELILPKSTSDLNADLGTLGNISNGEGVVFSQQLNSLKILASIMTSNDAMRYVWEQDPEKELYPRLETYKGLFQISPQSESTVIEIEVDGSSPEIAQERAVNLINNFQQRLNQLRADDAGGRSQFLQKELDKAKEDLKLAQTRLKNYQESSNLVSSDNQTQDILATIKSLSTERAQVTAEARASEARVRELSSRLNLAPGSALQSLRLGENQQYQSLQKELAQIEADLSQARSQFLDNSPQVQTLLDARKRIRLRLEEYGDIQTTTSQAIGSDSANLVQELILAESAAKAFNQRAEQLRQEVDKLNDQLQLLPAKQEQLVELERQYHIAEGVYNGLVAQVQQSKVSAFSTYPNIQILDYPNVDSKPTKPNKKLIALGAILASGFGSTALGLFLSERDPLLGTKDIQLADLPILANIPKVRGPEMEIHLDAETITEFQRLASSVSLMTLKHNRLMISSTTAGEGKTTVLLGLATALSTLGFRVLMVDGDFRKGELSKRLGYMRQTEADLFPLKPMKINPGLDLLPTTPQQDDNQIMGYVAQGAFEQNLDSIQSTRDYDYILVDSAPVDLTSETAMMAKVISNVLYVVKPGLTNKNEFNASVEQLVNHRSTINGLVLNGTRREKDKYIYPKNRIYLPQE